MPRTSAVLERIAPAVHDEHAPATPIRVLAFVEARGVTGALRNLLEFASHAANAVRFELATYWRSPRPGVPGPFTEDIQQAIDAAAALGIPTHVLHERYPGDPRLFPQVRDLLRRTNADIVETHHVKSHALLAACGVAVANRWVAYHHGYTMTTLKTRVVNLLDRWSLEKPAAIVTPCRAFATELSRRGVEAGRITVVHSSVSLPVRATSTAARPPLGLGVQDRIVLAVGRLSHEKAHSVLIEAFARPPLSRCSNAALVIVGDGPERGALAALARRRGLSRVHFAGQQADVWRYYDAADVVALPSDSEGSPIALLEAMAAGKAVVASRVGGVPEIIEHGAAGFLVQPRDPDALSSALARVLEDSTLAAALGERARSTASVRFTVDARARALTAVYRRVSQA